MTTATKPGTLAELVAELERRLRGESPGGYLTASVARTIPDARSYVLVLFDGLGDHQLDIEEASSLRKSRAAMVHSPFPSTTTVSLSSIATAQSPLNHGVIGHLMWLEEVDTVVNTLKWVDLGGRPVAFPTERLLPSPNLWERLSTSGLEPITVQPGDFAKTPLTTALYRGCRFEGAFGVEETIEATCTLARQPGRLILTYFPQVDYAAHVWGLRSTRYREAVRLVNDAWDQILHRLPADAAVIGTADHGVIEYSEEAKLLIRDPELDELVFWGDPRSVYVRGDMRLIEELAMRTGGSVVMPGDLEEMWGEGTAHPLLGARKPDAALLAAPGTVILPKGFDKRLVGYHGGLEPGELHVPLLVGP